jgi:tRNA(Met) cytidine acetyltransferase
LPWPSAFQQDLQGWRQARAALRLDGISRQSHRCKTQLKQPDPNNLVDLALALRTQAARTGHRRLLLLEGDAEPGRAAAHAIVEAIVNSIGGRGERSTSQWIGASDERDALPAAQAVALLGGECALLIIDAHCGLDADALGAAAGTLQGGGLLLLLAPMLAAWPALTDPQAERIAVYPHGAGAVGGRFIARLGRLLAASPAVVRRAVGKTASNPPEHRGASSALPQPPTSYPPGKPNAAGSQPPRRIAAASADQARAIDAVRKVAEGRARRPLVLIADRGRGKSAALGIAAGQLLAQRDRHIVVTAPRRAAAEAIFEHASAVDASARARLRFIAPDALLAEPPRTDLLLVDEAAGIPAPLLERMLMAHSRIVFATTVHGYEGTGRGFEVRFRGVLDRVTPGWRALRLSTPIRWAADDPLERLIAQALLLDAEPAPDHQVATISARCEAAQLRFETLDRDRLAADEPLLRQLFGLLVLGHYQTRPADLRHLLDGPNMAVSILRSGDTLLATALSAREGQLPETLLAPIFEGRRRPRGHLLPQTLSAHAGLFDAPRLGFIRIVRISVHPAARGRGIGMRLMRLLAEQAQGLAADRANGRATAEDGHRDLIGASFGATPELLRFWRRCGLLPVQLGSHRNAASGAHAAVVLKPLSAPGMALFERARARLPGRLAVLLLGPLRQLEPAVVAELLHAAHGQDAPLDADERRELLAFAQASRSLEAALPALHRLTSSALPRALETGALTPAQGKALILHVLQQRPPSARDHSPCQLGKAATLSLLRQAAGQLLAADGGGSARR